VSWITLMPIESTPESKVEEDVEKAELDIVV
jgi:hypothetical protein